jgi:hypothetical protein
VIIRDGTTKRNQVEKLYEEIELRVRPAPVRRRKTSK